MRVSECAVVEGVLAAWGARDLDLLGRSIAHDCVYRLHLPEKAWPIAGTVGGRPRIIRCFTEFLREFEIVEYRLLGVRAADGEFASRVKLHYGHCATGLSYEATIRNEGRMAGDKITYFEVFHDTARLKAFYEMVKRLTVEA